MSRRRPSIRIALAALAALAGALAALPAGAAGQIPGVPSAPIPGPSLTPVEEFQGAAATPSPLSAGAPPQHPFMAPNERSNIHNDPYMTDVYRGGGPLGQGTTTNSAFFLRECGSVTFDSKGRIVTVCVGLDLPILTLMDPQTLAVIATFPLPPRILNGALNPFTDFSGGGYFYLDHRGHAIVPTSTRHIFDIELVDGPLGPVFQMARDYDVSAEVPLGQGIVSVLPDWSGRLWFIGRGGVVGTIDRDSGAAHSTQLPGSEGISNSFSVDETGGVFIVSDKALYRFDAGPAGEPEISWREVYPNSDIHKPGQSDAGSGTTPTLMGRDWVSITDNADPMDVVIYRRERSPTEASRHVCTQPVFRAGAGDTDQSLIGTDDSVVAENNYGYSGPAATEFGGTTEPGLARVEVVARPAGTLSATKGKTKHKKKKKRKKRKRKHRRKHRRDHDRQHRRAGPERIDYSCRVVWESSERAPSVVPKLSLATGLVYTYTKPPRPDGADAWFFTALDYRTGATVFKRLAGIGLGFNNNYAPVTLGPDGSAYVGVLGGLTRFHDPP